MQLERVALGVLTAACGSAIAGDLTTRDGVFTAAQALRGKEVYEESCLACHQVDFYETKLLAWQDAPVGEFLAAISATMPSANPGGLATSEYLDVVAYIFSITGSPAGEKELSVGNMDEIDIAVPVRGP